MADVVNKGTVLDETFADTDPVTSGEFKAQDEYHMVAINVAATTEDMALEIELRDEEGDWHVVDTDTTLAGETDVIVVANAGRMRVTVTPAAAPSSAKIWVRAHGG